MTDVTGDTTPPPADAITIDGDPETAYRQGLEDGAAAERQRICDDERTDGPVEFPIGPAYIVPADLLDGDTP